MRRKLQELQILLQANPRQAALLGTLALIAVGMWLRVMATGRPAAKVIASQTQTAASLKDSARRESAQEVNDAQKPPVRIPAPAPLTRDLFRKTPAELALSDQTDRGPAGEAKSQEPLVENPEQSDSADEQALARLVREEAARLTVRSIVLGANPVAVIENAGSQTRPVVVRQGQSVSGFTVLRIEQGAVTVRKDGVTIRLGLAGRG